MITVYYSSTFVRLYSGLDPNLKEEVKEAISLFSDAKNHSKLKVHKFAGSLNGRYSFSVNYKFRIVFRYAGEQEKVACFLYVGPHDQAYK